MFPFSTACIHFFLRTLFSLFFLLFMFLKNITKAGLALLLFNKTRVSFACQEKYFFFENLTEKYIENL